MLAKEARINASVLAEANVQPAAANITRKIAAEWVESYPIPNDGLSAIG